MKKSAAFSDPKLRVVSHKARHLRHEKDCLNCGHHIEDRFCSHCGQENTEKRQSFSHLLAHVIEDLTHYDGGFWITIRYLLFRPGLLTNAYLSGKRASFVVPVKLYIFISFICFFLPGILPDFSTAGSSGTHAKPAVSEHSQAALHHTADTAIARSSHDSLTPTSAQEHNTSRRGIFWLGITTSPDHEGMIFERPHDYHTVAELDAAEQALPAAKRYNWLQYRMAKRVITIYDHYSDQEIWERFKDAFIHNIPKALFLYMPFFAFFLWLFHGKTRWLYFDHAIFTLHYFSLMLLLVTILNIFQSVLSPAAHMDWAYYAGIFVNMACFVWMFFYFFVAHRRVYQESRLVSSLKSLMLFGINMIGLVFLLLIMANITLFTLH